MERTHWLQLIAGTIGGALGWFWGGFDETIYCLIIFVIADYASGVFCAVIKKTLSSEVGAKGILKKILIFLIIGVAHWLDIIFFDNGADVLRLAATFFYIANEGISLIENAAVLGLPVPKKIINILHQIKKEADEEETAESEEKE